MCVREVPLASTKQNCEHSVSLSWSDWSCTSHLASLPPQASLPAATGTKKRAGPSATDLENVSPGLLLKPVDRSAAVLSAILMGQQAQQGGWELGDRVVHVGSSGTPPFGQRGTVVGVHEEGAFVEVCLQ